ncbi:MAG: SLC13 family permease [Flavobacteriaceae bacterium]|nr:SLC13 family permease [Flavobacteriaceae bacterium]
MYLVLGIMIVLVILLISDRIKPHIVFLGSALALMITGILDPKVFLASFANESIATIFVLILLTAALNNNFNIIKYLDTIFTQKKKPRLFLFQMTASVSLLSSVMNNTPIVAMLIPYILRWSKKMKVSPSRLLIPLSFAALAGGMITIIGTSTNLVLNGFIESKGQQPFAFFDFLVPGLLVAGSSVIFMSTAGYFLLKDRKNPSDIVKENLKEYLVEIALSPDSIHVGKTITQAGLRNLQGVYLAEIFRNGKMLSPVTPDEILEQNDRLFFAGDTTDILEIVKEESGFKFPKTEHFNLQGQLEIVEALIPYNSNLSGRTLKESSFREKYDAAVIAIHRNGERLSGKLGEIKLSHGDMLMLTAGKNFDKSMSGDSDLYKISIKEKLGKVDKWKSQILAGVAIASLIGMISGFLPFFVGILLILATFFGLRLMSEQELLKNLNIDLFLILGSAIALGTAFIETGGARFVSDAVIDVFSAYGNISVIIGLYLLTVILTSFITNAAAVSIVFPVAYEMSHSLSIEPHAIYLAIAFGASCSFLTPFGYQTNLMVYGPGGYKFNDFLRIGIPITLIYSIACLAYILIHFNIKA